MNQISQQDAMTWMARLAATDGVVTPTERKVLSDFAKTFDIDAGKLIRMAYGFTKDVDLPEVDFVDRNEMKGRMFERFVVSLLGSNCRLLAWRSDKIVGNTYAAENLYPDLHIRHRLEDATVEYLVECKFRSAWVDDAIDLSDYFNRYLFHAKERGLELFIALGVGGSPSAPDELYLIPGRKLKREKIIDRTRFLKYLCGHTTDDYHRYITNHYQKRIFKHPPT